MPAAHYNVVIAGGGMVGSLLAALLRTGLATPPSVAVVDPAPQPDPDARPDTPSFDSRATALAFGSRAVLETAGAWDTLAERACPIDSIHVSERGRFGSVLMTAEQAGWPALGYVTENRDLGAALMARLRSLPAVDWLTDRVTDVRTDPDGPELTLASGGSLRTDLLVVADGSPSALAARLGIQEQTHRYDQQAIVATVAMDRPHGGRAFERFTDQGPLALLPLPDHAGQHRAALVWTLPPEAVDTVMALDDDVFLQRLQQRFGYRLGRLVRAGERTAYPLQRRLAREQVRPGVVLMGNAAHFLHPVAGQGFNLAVRDAAALQHALAHRVDGEGWGDFALLQRYARARHADQATTVGASDGLVRTFGVAHWLVRGARGLGLLGLDSLDALRREFVHEAGGMGRHRPAGSA